MVSATLSKRLCLLLPTAGLYNHAGQPIVKFREEKTLRFLKIGGIDEVAPVNTPLVVVEWHSPITECHLHKQV